MVRAALLAAAVCMDSLFAAMGCSAGGIRIPKHSALLISAVGTAFLAFSLLCGEILAAVVPSALCRYVGALLLGIMGLSQLCRGMLRQVFRLHEQVQVHWLGLVVQICLDETSADTDGSKVLSAGEAFAFAAAFSMDSLASGLGAGIADRAIPFCLGMSLLLGFLMTVLGDRMGRICRKQRDFSWIGGILLLLLAVSRAMG